MTAKIHSPVQVATGVSGLDQILGGGLLRERAYLVSGESGTGKTTIGLHFLTRSAEGPALFIGFTTPEERVRADAALFGFDLRNVSFLDLTADADIFSNVLSYDIFSPVEVEREPIAREIRCRIEEVRPHRIYMDGFSELSLISGDRFHFHRMVQSLFRFIAASKATLLVSAEDPAELLALVDGAIHLVRREHERSLEILKMRGHGFTAGLHPTRITESGVIVFPLAS